MSLPVCVFDVCVCVFVCLVGKRRRTPQVVQVRGRSLRGRSPGPWPLCSRLWLRLRGEFVQGPSLGLKRALPFFFFFLLSRTTSDLLTFSALIVD